MNTDREGECLQTLARLRSTTTDDLKVRIEFLEIKALRDFERLRAAEKYPDYQDGSFRSNFLIGFYDYASLVTNPSLRKRTIVAVMTMVFQQWNGVSRQPCIHSNALAESKSGQRHLILRPVHLRR